MNAPPWARLLPVPALEAQHPNIELIEKRGLLDLDDSDLPAPAYNEEVLPDLVGPYQVSKEAQREFRRENWKRYQRTAANLAEEGLPYVEKELERIEEEIEALRWLRDQCVKAEDQQNHQLQHRPTYSDDADESFQNYMDALSDLRSEIARIRVHLKVRKKVFEETVSHLRRGKEPGELMPKDPPYSDAVNEYLRLAYYWYRDGNRCKGDKPTELWKYLSEQTGKSRAAPRERFKAYDWYDPYGNPTPADYTREAILEEGSKYY